MLLSMWCCYPISSIDKSDQRLQEPLDEEEAIKAVHEAFRKGINYFDTSPYYGNLRSEKVGGCPTESTLHAVPAVLRQCFAVRAA